MKIIKILFFSVVLFLIGCGKVGVSKSDGDYSVESAPQIINIYIDANNVNAPHTINFRAIVQDNEPTENLQYLWHFGDGTTSNLTNPAHNYTYQGEFSYSLSITDRHGNSTSLEGPTKIYLIGGNRRPEISFCMADKYTAVKGEEINFSAEATDPDIGDILTYSWNFGDGNNATGKNTAHAFIDENIFQVKLTVSDLSGATSEHTIPIGIGVKIPPIIEVFDWTPDDGFIPATINFSAQAIDYDGEITAYLWDFGDHNSATTKNPTHIYTTGGNYLVKLTVYDNEGLIAVTSNYISIFNQEE